jgi:hypothetical protein
MSVATCCGVWGWLGLGCPRSPEWEALPTASVLVAVCVGTERSGLSMCQTHHPSWPALSAVSHSKGTKRMPERSEGIKVPWKKSQMGFICTAPLGLLVHLCETCQGFISQDGCENETRSLPSAAPLPSTCGHSYGKQGPIDITVSVWALCWVFSMSGWFTFFLINTF